MRALVCHSLSDDFRGVSVAEIDAPQPGPGEMAVRVRAASVNFPDLLMCQGLYQFKPEPPFTPGMDIAGDVVDLGAGVSGFAIGDEVTAGVRLGGFAEIALVSAAAAKPKPAAFDWAKASAYQAAYLTAYVALHRRAHVQRGETVLVHGAAGGVGLACVDLARRAGATVIATASTPEKRKFLAGYGADHVLDATGFRDHVKAMTGGRGADVIYDPVGGDVFDESVRCIAFDGRLLVIGFTSGRIPTISANMPLIKGFSVVGVRAGEYGRQFPERGRENLDAIWALADAGEIRPHICAELPLSRALEGFAMLRERRAFGKVVLRPDVER
ncbi:MAG: NADPH:quinone oxidoreductase family protein [Caulobacterales bacterium]